MLEKYFHLKAGGLSLNPHHPEYFDEGKLRDNENHILFFCEFIFLLDMYKENPKIFIPAYLKIKELLQVDGYKGLYHRGYGELKYHEVTKEIVDQSHDNLTAFACLDYYFFGHFNDIMDHLKKYNWRYDNATPSNPSFKRILHPRDILFLNYLNGSVLSYLALPLLTLMAAYSCFKTKEVRPTWYQILWDKIFNTGLPSQHEEFSTSGKCLWFIRLYATKDRKWSKFTWWLCEKIMKFRANIDFLDAIKMYFLQRTKYLHPNIEMVGMFRSVQYGEDR